jgi:hypothetical protein
VHNDADNRQARAKRAVWIHRGLALFFAALVLPAVLWWSESVLFVILLSLATQISTEVGSANAANDEAVTDRLAHIEAQLDALLEQRRRADG